MKTAILKAIPIALINKFVEGKSPLTIMQPSSLAEITKDLDASLGNFGHITYGQTIIGKVLYPKEGNRFGCEPITWEHFSSTQSD